MQWYTWYLDFTICLMIDDCMDICCGSLCVMFLGIWLCFILFRVFFGQKEALGVVQRVHSWLLWCLGPQRYNNSHQLGVFGVDNTPKVQHGTLKIDSFQSRNLLFQLIFRWTMLNFRGVLDVGRYDFCWAVPVVKRLDLCSRGVAAQLQPFFRWGDWLCISQLWFQLHGRPKIRLHSHRHRLRQTWQIMTFPFRMASLHGICYFLYNWAPIFIIGEQGLTNIRNWFWPKTKFERWFSCKNFLTSKNKNKSLVAMVPLTKRFDLVSKPSGFNVLIEQTHTRWGPVGADDGFLAHT